MVTIKIKKTENLLILTLILVSVSFILKLMGGDILSRILLVVGLLPIPTFLFIEAKKQKDMFLLLLGLAVTLVIAYGTYIVCC